MVPYVIIYYVMSQFTVISRCCDMGYTALQIVVCSVILSAKIYLNVHKFGFYCNIFYM